LVEDIDAPDLRIFEVSFKHASVWAIGFWSMATPIPITCHIKSAMMPAHGNLKHIAYLQWFLN
jgi:hypothetical protein